jgi:hypothetical protein
MPRLTARSLGSLRVGVTGYLFRFEGVSASQDTIAKNPDFKPHASLVVMMFIGSRDAYYTCDGSLLLLIAAFVLTVSRGMYGF